MAAAARAYARGRRASWQEELSYDVRRQSTLAVRHSTRRLSAHEGSEEVQAVFDNYDEDWSGFLDRAELYAALEDLGVVRVKHTQVEQLMMQLGADEARGVDVSQFFRLVLATRKLNQQAREKEEQAERWEFGSDRLPHQASVRHVYRTRWFTNTVATIILLNFVGNIVEKEVDPMGVNAAVVWQVLDVIFTTIFGFELCINSAPAGRTRDPAGHFARTL